MSKWQCCEDVPYPSDTVFLAYSDSEGYLWWKPASQLDPPDILQADKCHKIYGMTADGKLVLEPRLGEEPFVRSAEDQKVIDLYLAFHKVHPSAAS